MASEWRQISEELDTEFWKAATTTDPMPNQSSVLQQDSPHQIDECNATEYTEVGPTENIHSAPGTLLHFCYIIVICDSAVYYIYAKLHYFRHEAFISDSCYKNYCNIQPHFKVTS